MFKLRKTSYGKEVNSLQTGHRVILIKNTTFKKHLTDSKYIWIRKGPRIAKTLQWTLMIY